MNINVVIQWIILGLLTLVLFTLVDPFMYWMPSMLQLVALTCSAGLLVVFAAFFVAEKANDEREAQHRMLAGRAAFLAGIAVLTTALVVQGLTHTLDVWIPLAIGAMIAAKLVARWFADRSN